jgi:amino acid adenylation domain-containing protein
MFDLVLSLHEGPNGIHGELFYKTDLFESATIQRMTTHFLALLEGVVANPEQTVSALPLLTQGERRQLLVEWNDTEKASPRDKWVHQLFEEQAERTPGAVAVLAPLPSQSNGESAGSLPIGNEELTYRELNTRANQLAHYLKKRGVGPEALVGICVERSLEMITGILGVLKAGAAYVPLDPNYPAERLAHIFDDARMRLVLTQKRLTESFSQFGLEVLWLDSEWEKICREPGENPSVQVTAENLAYVIYTSGSTGKPKGVGVAHRPLANYTQVASELFALSSNDRVLQFASISFDTSVEEIFPCLTRGATLVLRTDAMLDGAASFLETCNEWGVNVVDLPTAYWHELIDPMVREGLTLPGCLRLMIIGGERAVPSQLMNWHRAVGDRAQLLNTYGPTEATVAATVWELNGTVSENESLREVPLGRPIANAQIYILDSHLQPVPIGVAGDLYIGGAGLARGYLNHSDQTADKFIPNPFSHRPGERLYRTGDLGRYLSDGDIEFLGRIDHQVKVRGYRIELGEIEAVLSCHPQVRHAVVLAREDASGEHSTTPRVNKRLVAYVVAAQAPAPSPSDLRSFLQATLPEYMIPSVFVFLDSLPLTSRGKVDRRVLPEPDQSSPELECDFVAPRTPIEKSMAEIWREVLKLERIGVKDNFFSLGGHSLLAMQVVYRVEKQFRLEVPLRVLFKNPTLEQLARFVHDRCAANEYGENVEGILSEIEALSDDAAWSLLGDKNRLGQA